MYIHISYDNFLDFFLQFSWQQSKNVIQFFFIRFNDEIFYLKQRSGRKSLINIRDMRCVLHNAVSITIAIAKY